MTCLSKLSGKTLTPKVGKPQCFRLDFLSAIAELENDPGKIFLQNLHNGATIGYEKDLGSCPEVFPGKTKQRIYDDPREFLGNYKTVLGKEEALQKVIDKDLEEGLVSGPFSWEQLSIKYPKVLLNSLGAEIKDLTKPDVRMLVDATQGGVNQQIRLTMQPTRPSLADCLRVLELLEKPAGAKIDGTSAHRRVITPENEHGLVSILGPNGMYYANTVGTFGVVSAGQNWDRLASAVHRWGLKLLGKEKVYVLLFSDDTIFLTENEIFDETFLAFIFFY